MATVRIYKVAELLGLSSQEAMDLLKKETGIDVKSASSSIEEIVARQFVERQARDAPDLAAARPVVCRCTGAEEAGRQGGKAPEPPKPAGPVLRPRLIKTIRPAAAEAPAAGRGGPRGGASRSVDASGR